MLANPHLRLYLGAILISFSPVFVNLVSVSPTTSGFYRVFFGGAAIAAWLLATRRRLKFSRRTWALIGGSAAFYAADLWFWHRSIGYIGPGLSTLLANLQVFFMMAAGVLFLKQRPSALQLIAVPLAIAGLVMIVGKDWQALTPGYRPGVILALLTAVSYAGYMLLMRAARLHSDYAVPSREIAAMSLLVAAMLGVSAAVEGESLAITTAGDAVWLLGYGLLSHAVGLMFIASSLTRVSAAETGIALLLQPALSFLWDILFFGRVTTGIEYLGVAVTLLAIFLGGRAVNRAPRIGR